MRDKHARLSLRVALSTLRRELGEDLALADRETIRLNPEVALWADAVEFGKSTDGIALPLTLVFPH